MYQFFTVNGYLSGVTANATVTVGNAGDADASTYTVTVDTIAGDGTLGLDIAGGNNIVDTLSNAIDVTPTTDELYTIDNTVPTVSITRDDANPTHATSVTFSVDFSEDVMGVEATDFVLDVSGVTANATVTVGNAGDLDASTYTVTVDTIAGDGTLGLDIDGGNNIIDLVTNAMGTTPTTDEAYTIVNDAPNITSSSSPNVAENTTTVITVTASDTDGDTPSFSITGGADQAELSINAISGDLTFNAAPNYESPTDSDANNVYLVEVTGDDGYGKTDVQLISVTVTDVDEFDVGAISDSDAEANQVAENAANGTVVGITAVASDADGSTNTITYSLDDDAGGRFAIDSSTGVITVVSGTQLDYEAATSHDITIKSTSADMSVSTQSLTINLTDVDEFMGPRPGSDPPPESEPPPASDDDAETEAEEETETEEAISVQGELAANIAPPVSAPQSDPQPSEQQAAVQIIVIPAAPEVESTGDAELLLSTTIGGYLPQSFKQTLRVVAEVAPQLVDYVDPQLFWEKLDDFQDGLRGDDQALKLTTGTVAITSLAMTAGYLFWMVNGGYLLAGMVSQMTAWQMVDPLPIFDAAAGGHWEDDEDDEIGL